MMAPLYWQGRRGPARDAELFAFGRFNPTMVVEGKAVGLPAAWSQTLDKTLASHSRKAAQV